MIHKKSWIKTIVFSGLIIFYGTILVQKINIPSASDLPRQIMIGKTIMAGNFNIFYKNIYSYTEPEHEFFNHHWLSGVIFYLFHEIVGFSGLVLLKIIVLLSAFSLIFFTATKKAHFWVVAFFSIPTILILAERSDVRPEIFSYLFVALYLFLLIDFEKNPQGKKIFWLIPMQLLWVNMHVFFSIGIMMVGAFLCEKIILNWRNLRANKDMQRLSILLVALIVVSCVNPRGVKGVIYHYPKGPVVINENVSLDTFQKTSSGWNNIPATLFKPMALLVGISFLFAFRRKPIFYLLAVIATVTLGFVILRGIALFGIIFLPTITANVSDAFEKWRRFLEKESFLIARAIGFIGGVCFIVVLGYLIVIFVPKKVIGYEERGIGVRHDSGSSADFFIQQDLSGPIFNDANSGSYLIYSLYPKEFVFTDNRFADAYSASFYDQIYFPSIRDEGEWQKNARKYEFNVIFFNHFIAGLEERKFLIRRVNDPAWAMVYADAYNLILLRNIPENAEIIQKFRITSSNGLERLRHLVDSRYINDQIAVADVLNILGRSDLALAMYFKVVSTWPNRHKVWEIMGQMEAYKDTPTDLVLASTFFQRAIDEGARTAQAYTYLGSVYYRLHLIESARIAVLEALDRDPQYEDARQLLNLIEKEGTR